MKIKITESAHHRIDSGRSQSYRTDGGIDKKGTYNVPQSTGEALIKRGVAKLASKPKTQKSED